MLSNPTNNLHNRQRHHRRQQSTPTAYEPVKVAILPTYPRHGSHRRGMSLDTRRRNSPPQGMTIQNTNQGYTTNLQHNLRETQQQRPIRPGPSPSYQNFANDENYLQSPAVTPQRQFFDIGQTYESQNVYTDPVITPTNVNFFAESHDYTVMNNGLTMPPSTHLNYNQMENFETTQMYGSRPSSRRRISGGIQGRVAQFEHMANKSSQRPSTPPTQNASGKPSVLPVELVLTKEAYAPLTPAGTPHRRTIKQEPVNQRFLETYDTSMEETIKPRGNQRSRGVFEQMRREAEQAYHSPEQPLPLDHVQLAAASAPQASFSHLHPLDVNFLKPEPQHDILLYGNYSSDVSPGLSYLSTPEIQDAAMFENAYADHVGSSQQSQVSPAHHTHRRSESISSAIGDEAAIETGVTLEDIAAFISGPEPSDGKWVCLYPECHKRFGRKENIKSHVQTHLGDRQFQCPHCNNRFVRQHDLKRHAKIHSGVKPYPCQCGNSFARHDALTRHRQRGMCIGAFAGIVKKTAKRGRPRKARPDDEKRIEKSSRTRVKNKDRDMSSASSTNGYSESSDASSPRSEIDLQEGTTFQNFGIMGSQNLCYNQVESPAPECVSPQVILAHSPSVFSSHAMSRNNSHHDLLPSPQQLPALPASPAKSAHSYHSPPGLCESSSSPAPSQYYDLDNMSNPEEDLSRLSLANIAEADEMFLEAFANGTDMSALGRDSGMLLGKYDETYQGGDMFTDPSDVFFGSP